MNNHSHHLILTVDYELFGDGSGCIESCVVEPAKNMLKIANEYSAKITFFADVIEFIKMEQEKEYFDGICKINKQLSASVKRGHDVQLHVHPQWINAKYLNHKWDLDFSAWRIADLKHDEILSVFQESIIWLENIIRSDNQNYSCNTFRAGGWCIQPSENVIHALQQVGIKMDSTVAPSFHNISQGEWSDFTSVPDKPFWLSDSDVCSEADKGIFEIPITTGKINKLMHLQVLKDAKKQGMAKDCIGSYQGPDGKYQVIKGKIWKLMNLGNVMLDFSTMTSSVLIEITKQWIDKYSYLEKPLPIVAIAHTKNFTSTSEKALRDYLSWAKKEGFVFSTYTNWLNIIND